jgi:transposase
LPDWPHVHKELKRRAVTLLLLWEEYRAEPADGYDRTKPELVPNQASKSARPALISLLSLSMTSVGVFLGAPTPYHPLAS